MIASVESMRAGSGRRRILLVIYDSVPRVVKNENRGFLVKAVTGCMYYINIRSKWLSSNIYVVLSE